MTARDLVVEDMSLSDLSEILAIESVSFAAPWTEEHFRREIEANPVAVNRVLRVQGSLAGYASAYVVAGELQVNVLAVAPAARGRGHGGRLLDDLVACALSRGATTATLEVRAGNAAARRLYERNGFVEVGRRPRYYACGDDAILMARALPVGLE